MANDFVTLADIQTLNDQNLADLNVSDLLDHAPILARLAADMSSNGELHKYLKETGAPVVGFRSANAGREYDVSEDTLVTITLKILDASYRCDKAVADIYQRGGAPGYLARELRRHLKASMFKAETQLINGDDAAGFDGLADALDDSDDAMVVNATGTTALTSVWFIRTTNDSSDVTLITNGNFEMGDTSVIEVNDGTDKFYPGYYTPVTGWMGLQIGSAYSVGRICNVGTDTGKGLTDILLSQMLEKFPSHLQPNLIAMNRRSRGQLQRSRTTYSPTGLPAPLPSEYEGIPIVTTDSIPNDETALTAA